MTMINAVVAPLPLPLPTGFRDRQPQPTPGWVRRVLARLPCLTEFPLPARLREQAAVTAHLPRGYLGQRPPPVTQAAVKAA